MGGCGKGGWVIPALLSLEAAVLLFNLNSTPFKIHFSAKIMSFLF